VQNTAPDTEQKVTCLVTQHPNFTLDLESWGGAREVGPILCERNTMHKQGNTTAGSVTAQPWGITIARF